MRGDDHADHGNRSRADRVSTISSARLPARPRDADLSNRCKRCSCFVHIWLLDHRHGSLFDSPETPAGAPSALLASAGGRLQPTRPGDQSRSAGRCRRGGRRRAAARARRAVECLGPLRAGRADRLRRRLAGVRRTAAVQDHGDGRRDAQDHHAQRLAGYLLRPLDQSLSRLRARLHLLLRAADARLSRPVARPRLRIEAVHEAGGGEAPGARAVRSEIFAAHDRDRHQHRSVSADREAVSDHAADS